MITITNPSNCPVPFVLNNLISTVTPVPGVILLPTSPSAFANNHTIYGYTTGAYGWIDPSQSYNVTIDFIIGPFFFFSSQKSKKKKTQKNSKKNRITSTN